MKTKREQAYGDLLVIKLFASNYARDLLYTSPGISLNSTQFAFRGMNGGFGSSHWGHGPWIHDGNRDW